MLRTARAVDRTILGTIVSPFPPAATDAGRLFPDIQSRVSDLSCTISSRDGSGRPRSAPRSRASAREVSENIVRTVSVRVFLASTAVRGSSGGSSEVRRTHPLAPRRRIEAHPALLAEKTTPFADWVKRPHGPHDLTRSRGSSAPRPITPSRPRRDPSWGECRSRSTRSCGASAPPGRAGCRRSGG